MKTPVVVYILDQDREEGKPSSRVLSGDGRVR